MQIICESIEELLQLADRLKPCRCASKLSDQLIDRTHSENTTKPDENEPEQPNEEEPIQHEERAKISETKKAELDFTQMFIDLATESGNYMASVDKLKLMLSNMGCKAVTEIPVDRIDDFIEEYKKEIGVE